MDSPDASINIERISIPKASDAVAHHIRRLIVEGKITPGMYFPSEKTLCEQLAVGRSTVREAIKILGTWGLISAVPGSRRRHVVQEAPLEGLTQTVELLLQLGQISVNDVTEVRLMLEPGAAELAAHHKTPADIQKMEEILEKMARNIGANYSSQDNYHFHVLIGYASHNPLVGALIEAMKLTICLVDEQVITTLEHQKTMLEQHSQLVDYIKNGDGNAARNLMVYHLSYSFTVLKQKAKEVFLSNRAKQVYASNEAK